jgi:hypothetical protein
MSFLLGSFGNLLNPHPPNWWLLKQRKTQFGANKTRPGKTYPTNKEKNDKRSQEMNPELKTTS